jgi:GNAT superfamily N-acetyltransferase
LSEPRRTLKTFTLRERPELGDELERLAAEGWPPFLRQRDELGLGRFWPRLFDDFADWQFVVCDSFDRVVAAGHSVPFPWDGGDPELPESIVAIMDRAVVARSESRRPSALSALAALVDVKQRGQGLSRVVIETMRRLAAQWNLRALVAPVRPTLKSSYPLTPIERYARWTDTEGLPFDPWMRVHARLGATVARVMPRALVIAGRVAAWEEWTDMRFPDTGSYVVPGALQPVVIDRDHDEGRYEDPNVWMVHPAS